MTLQTEPSDDPRSGEPKPLYRAGREPSLTAMVHACLRNTHATAHTSPIFTDTRSVQLVPADIRERAQAYLDGFSPQTADALVLMAVIRYRVLAERLPEAHRRGIRQFVILGAGLDTTGFALPAWADAWRVFEVDHPATQDWKRAQIANLGWETPPNLVFAPCDFETQQLVSALDAAGFDLTQPAVLSLFGVILYLTLDATRATLRQLASLAAQSEVTISYSPPPAETSAAAMEARQKTSPIVDASGESFVGDYRDFEIERLVRQAGFSEVIHYPSTMLNARYFGGRSDALRLDPIEQLLTAVV